MGRLRIPLISTGARWSAVLAVLAGMVYASIGVDPSSGGASSLLSATTFADKPLHVGAHAVLTVSLAYATAGQVRSSRRRMVAIVALAFVIGIGIEVLQGGLADRTFSVGDILANGLGVLAGSTWFLLEPHIQYSTAPEGPE